MMWNSQDLLQQSIPQKNLALATMLGMCRHHFPAVETKMPLTKRLVYFTLGRIELVCTHTLGPF